MSVVRRVLTSPRLVLLTALALAACGSDPDDQPFQTADDQPLQLVSSVPAANASDFDPAGPIVLTFDGPVREGSVEVSLTDASQQEVPTSLTYSSDTVEVSASLEPLSDYALAILAGEDAAGNPLEDAPIEISFQTSDGTAQPSTFADVQPIFTTSCARSGCHAGKFPAAGMSLEAGQAFDQIVGVATTTGQCNKTTAGVRVEPGDPEGSCLYVLVESGAMPSGSPRLSAAKLETIRKWIADGASR